MGTVDEQHRNLFAVPRRVSGIGVHVAFDETNSVVGNDPKGEFASLVAEVAALAGQK